jgi:hypothetical protein
MSQEGPIKSIVTALRRIQEEGGSGNFVIFTAGAKENYYIQFAGGVGEPKLYAEAVSNECLEPALWLNEDQIARLQSMGWNPPTGTPNFHREWQATTDSDRLVIASAVMLTFVEIYGVSPDRELDINLVLQ